MHQEEKVWNRSGRGRDEWVVLREISFPVASRVGEGRLSEARGLDV